MDVVILAVIKQSITLDPEVYEEFCRYAGKHGIKVSTWVNAQMIQFIEEQKDVRGNQKEEAIRMSSGSKELVYNDFFIIGNPFLFLIALCLFILLGLTIFHLFKRKK